MSKLKKLVDNNVIKKDFSYADCKANYQKILLSFAYLTDEPKYGIGALRNGKNDAKFMNALIQAFRIITDNDWNTLINARHEIAFESMPLSAIEPSLVNRLKHVTPEEKVYIYRLPSVHARLILRRGRQCRRVAQVLACERNLGDAYNHGS